MNREQHKRVLKGTTLCTSAEFHEEEIDMLLEWLDDHLETARHYIGAKFLPCEISFHETGRSVIGQTHMFRCTCGVVYDCTDYEG